MYKVVYSIKLLKNYLQWEIKDGLINLCDCYKYNDIINIKIAVRK